MRSLATSLLAALLLATGCASFQMPFLRDRGISSGFTLEGLQQELVFLASSFAAAVTTGAEDITSASSLRRVRRNALIWRLHMIPVAQRVAAIQSDPRASYLQSLLLTTLQRQYFESGDGRDLFGEQQSIALDVAKRLEEQASEIGERFLTQAELKRVLTEVSSFAQRFPIQGREFSLQRALSGSIELQQSALITQVLSIPLAPFRALEGVDSGAQAIREFNLTARRFTDVAAGLPVQLRGELELFLYDVEDRETVVQGLAALETLAASADRASLTVEGLPEDLRASLEATLQGSQHSVEQIRATVDQLRALVGPLDQASGSLRDASLAWREVIGSRAERDAEPDTGPPFDVRDWGSAATAIGNAAVELRGLAVHAGQLSGSDALTLAIDRSIDRIFWRSAALIALLFAALVAYRVIASRLARAG